MAGNYKYDPDELDDTKVHLFAKDYHKSLKERGIKTPLKHLKEFLHGERHDWENEIQSKTRSAYRSLNKKYGEGTDMTQHGEGRPHGTK